MLKLTLLFRVSEHVKNYRPKLLLFSGPPSSRPSLVHFANLITKRISLLSTTHVVKDPDIDWTEVDALRTSAQDWCLGNKVVSTFPKYDPFNDHLLHPG